MDREQILYAAGATMLMCIVALLFLFIWRFCRKAHRKNVMVNMALEALNEVFPRIAKINYRTAECVFIRDKGETMATPFETYDWYEFRTPFLDSIYPEDQERLRTFTSLEHMRRIKENELVSDTSVYKRKQQKGEYQWMQMIIVPAKEQDCVMIYARSVDESVLSEELYKEQLWEMLQKTRDAELSKEEFLRYLCNDLHIPLDEVIELNSLAREMIGRGELQQAGYHLARVESAVNYILTVLNDIFQVSVFPEEYVKSPKTPFSLREVLQTCQTYCKKADLAKKDVSFKLELDERLKQQYNGDEGRLTQLLNALLSNAYKFNREGGSILLKVSLEKAGSGYDEIAVAVGDTGCGICGERLEAVQNWFNQEKQLSGRAGQSAGLGFFFMKRALYAIGGRMQIESKVGEGSRFTVFLKLDYVEASAERAREPLPFVLPKNHEMHLEMAPFHPMGCGSGGQALKVFQEGMPDVFEVLMAELEMPELDGHQPAFELRRSEHEKYG